MFALAFTSALVAPVPVFLPEPGALVKQLESQSYAEREAACAQLRVLGSRAVPALRAGQKSEDPEVRSRCSDVLFAIRKDARADFARNFDPTAERVPDHPLWTRFKALVGDSRASRELFARVIKNPEWLRRLDAAEIGADEAARQYLAALSGIDAAELGVLYKPDLSERRSCIGADEVVYLLFLGGFPGTEKVNGDDPQSETMYHLAERVVFQCRGTANGLRGKELASDQKSGNTVELTPGSDRVFAKLLTESLTRRRNSNTVVVGFESAVAHRVSEVLPLARATAANTAVRPAVRCAALKAVAQFGERTDLPLFEALFDDITEVYSWVLFFDKGEQTVRATEARDEACALALLLCDRDPADFGFAVPGDRFQRENGRPAVGKYQREDFAFWDELTRDLAHEQAREFFFKQRRINDQTAPPPRAKE